MSRLRHIPSTLLMLALVLQCTQMCLAAGFAHTASRDAHTTAAKTHDAPCHTTDSSAPDTSEECSSCRGHIFLKGSSPVTELHVAAEALAPLLYLLSPSQLFALPSSLFHTNLQQLVASSPALYLALAVLRF